MNPAADPILTFLRAHSLWLLWLAAGSIGGIGLLILGWSLLADWFRTRRRKLRRCPKCWYDMSGSGDSLRCPECGHLASRESKLYKSRRRWRWAALGLLLALFLPLGFIAQLVREQGWYALLPKYKTVSETWINGCRVRLLDHRDPMGFDRAVEIRRGRWGKPILLEAPSHFELGSMPWKDDGSGRDESKIVGFGEDITGNGVPDLIVEEYTGGAHCCTIFHIYELGDTPKLLQEIDTSYGGGVFKDLDGDFLPELVLQDWTFAYWKTSFASSPAPRLALKFDGKRYCLADTLMRKPAPDPIKLQALAMSLREDPAWSIGSPSTKSGPVNPVELWRTMLDLIYTGHMDLAWKFYDEVWPLNKPGKTEFLAEFVSQFAKSPYWPDLRRMNGELP